MKILLTGANGYIGKRLLTVLLGLQYEVICCVRDKKRFHFETVELQRIQVIEIDLLDKESLNKLPKDIDGAYYLVHSMSNSENFNELEEKCALNFQKYL